VTLSRRTGSGASAVQPNRRLRHGLVVDGLPAAVPSGATAVFTPTLARGAFDLGCTDRGRVRSALGHSPFFVGMRPRSAI